MQTRKYQKVVMWDFDGPINNPNRVGSIIPSASRPKNWTSAYSNFAHDNDMRVNNGPLLKLTLELLQSNQVLSVLGSHRIFMQNDPNCKQEDMYLALDILFGTQSRPYFTNEHTQIISRASTRRDSERSKVSLLKNISKLPLCHAIAKKDILLVDTQENYRQSTEAAGYEFVHAERSADDSYQDNKYLCEILFRTCPKQLLPSQFRALDDHSDQALATMNEFLFRYLDEVDISPDIINAYINKFRSLYDFDDTLFSLKIILKHFSKISAGFQLLLKNPINLCVDHCLATTTSFLSKLVDDYQETYQLDKDEIHLRVNHLEKLIDIKKYALQFETPAKAQALIATQFATANAYVECLTKALTYQETIKQVWKRFSTKIASMAGNLENAVSFFSIGKNAKAIAIREALRRQEENFMELATQQYLETKKELSQDQLYKLFLNNSINRAPSIQDTLDLRRYNLNPLLFFFPNTITQTQSRIEIDHWIKAKM